MFIKRLIYVNIQGERNERTEQSEYPGITDTAQASCEIQRKIPEEIRGKI